MSEEGVERVSKWIDAAATRIEDLEAEVARLQEELEAYKEAIDYVRGCYPEDVFLPDSDSLDASSARWARMVCDNIKAEAERRTALSPTPEEEE